MASEYTVHNFKKGDPILASDMNELDAQIKANADDILTKQDKLIAGSGISIAEDGVTISSTGGTGAVSSVNDQTGAVTLDAEDVGALPDTTVIPTVPDKVSAFENDAGYLTEHQDISGKANVGDSYTKAQSDAKYLTEHQSLEGYATETYVDEKVSGLVNSAPETLDTLQQLAAALGNDENFSTTVATEIGKKQDKLTAGKNITIGQDGTISASGDAVTAENIKSALGYTPANSDTVTTELDKKQNKLVAGTNITIAEDGKTISAAGDVASVNGKTGQVELDAEDVGALPDTTVALKNPFVLKINSTEYDGSAYREINISGSGSAVAIVSVVLSEANGNQLKAGTWSGLSLSTSTAINEDMRVLECTVGTPSAQGSDWVFTTADSSLTFTGTVSADTDLTLVLGMDGTSEIEKMSGGVIESGNAKFVTGGQVYSAIDPANIPTSLSSTQKVGEAISQLNSNLASGIIGTKKLVFNDDGTVTWTAV